MIFLSLHIHLFQSSLPRGERRNHSVNITPVSNFNPRSREGSDFDKEKVIANLQDISILAPARGATPYFSESFLLDP